MATLIDMPDADAAADSYELRLSDGKHHAIVRLAHEELVKAMAMGPVYVARFVAGQISFGLYAIHARENGIPLLGDRVRWAGSDDVHSVCGTDRKTGEVMLTKGLHWRSHEDNGPWVPWADCRYAE